MQPVVGLLVGLSAVPFVVLLLWIRFIHGLNENGEDLRFRNRLYLPILAMVRQVEKPKIRPQGFKFCTIPCCFVVQ